MKNIAKVLIILFSALLFFQLIYYNYINLKETKKSGIIENNKSENINEKIYNDVKNNDNPQIIEIPDDIILPEDFFLMDRFYNGYMEIEEIRKIIEKFIKEDVEIIHKQTTGKSINNKLQYYDNHTEEINELDIYNSEDYLEISRQINLLKSSDAYESSEIDRNDFSITNDGYTKIKLIITYKSKKQIKLYIHIANEENIKPSFKFSSAN